MIPNLEGVDPDDAFSSIPYKKGFSLLYQLETLVGVEGEFPDPMQYWAALITKGELMWSQV